MSNTFYQGAKNFLGELLPPCAPLLRACDSLYCKLRAIFQ